MSYKTFGQLKKKEKVVPRVSIDLQNQNHLQKLLQTNRILLLYVWAPWCRPCKLIANDFEKLAAEHSNIIFCKDNIDLDESYHKHKVTVVPTFFFYAYGKISKLEGADFNVIRTTIKNLLQKRSVANRK